MMYRGVETIVRKEPRFDEMKICLFKDTMKFKAVLRDTKAMTAICHAIRSFHRRCIIKLHNDRCRIIANQGSSDDQTQVWTALRADVAFQDLRIESRLDNAIYLEIADIAHLQFAMRSADRPKVTSMIKLAKSGDRSVLAVSIQGGTGDAVFELPVQVLAESQVALMLRPPSIENEMLQVRMPHLLDLVGFVDRMKSAQCTQLTMTSHRTRGAKTCVLTIKGVSFVSSFSVKFHETEILGEVAAQKEPTFLDHTLQTSVTIDMKSFTRFLAVRDSNPTQVIAHLVPNRVIVLTAYSASETVLVFYIPAMTI